MNVLFISTKSPLPANDGHCLRTFNLLRQIARKHQVHLLSFIKYEEEYRYRKDLEKFCQTVKLFRIPENFSRLRLGLSLSMSILESRPFVVRKYHTKSMAATVRQVVRERGIELVHLDMLPLYCYRDILGDLPVVLNEHNVESVLLLRQVEAGCRGIKRWYLALQQRKLEAFERAALSGCDRVAFCSEKDLGLAQTLCPEGQYAVIQNGVDGEYFRPVGGRRQDGMDLVFVGGMNWPPNRDALMWFDSEVLPVVIAKCPRVRLHVIGRREKGLRWMHPDHIVSHGVVEDIRPFLESSAVYVVPLRIGGGTRLKILDAMAMEMPIVATSVAVEGLDCVNGRDLLVRDQSVIFAEEVLRLLADGQERVALGKRARAFVVRKYDWKTIGDRMVSLYQDAVEHP